MGGVFSGQCTSSARLDGKTAVVTGANTGIGYETAKELLNRGARVILACRNVQRAKSAADRLRAEVAHSHTYPDHLLRVVRLDLASLRSVRECAHELLRTEAEIHLLVNNAGMRYPLHTLTEDGYEQTFQANHLGHFLLTRLLIQKLIHSAPARVVNLSDRLHENVAVNFEDLQSIQSYNEAEVYLQSKLCTVLFTLELRDRLKGTGVVAYSVHPGAAATNLGQHRAGCSRAVSAVGAWLKKTPLQGAQTTLHCAVDEGLAEQKGLYYSDCKEEAPSSKARNKEDAVRLWQVSEELVDNFLR